MKGRDMSGTANAQYHSVFRPDLFKGQAGIVTGGGSGIGRCIAHELASLGAHVILIGRKRDKLETVLDEICEDGGSAQICALDIREEEAVERAIAGLVTTHGRLDFLVNNAGGQFPAEVADISKKGWDAVLATNLTGGWLMMRAAFKHAMKETGGAIVNITADMHAGMPGMAHSGAARAGMFNLTQTAALEWGKHGVRVNAVAPGWIASSGMDTYGGSTRAMIPYLKQHVPAQRLGSEAEVSAGVVFLLSPAAAFITGVQLQIDGGAPLGSRIWPLEAHENAEVFNGFHRAVDPAVLRGEEAGDA